MLSEFIEEALIGYLEETKPLTLIMRLIEFL